MNDKLAAHVKLCKDFIYRGIKAGYASSQPMPEKVYCGAGPDSGRGRSWLCDKGKEIEETR